MTVDKKRRKVLKIAIKGILLGVLFSLAFVNCSAGIGGFDNVGSVYSKVARSEEYSSKIGPKEGKSCQNSVLGLFAWGDSSLPAAARDGKISQIVTVAYENTGFLVVAYRVQCTLVTGN